MPIVNVEAEAAEGIVEMHKALEDAFDEVHRLTHRGVDLGTVAALHGRRRDWITRTAHHLYLYDRYPTDNLELMVRVDLSMREEDREWFLANIPAIMEAMEPWRRSTLLRSGLRLRENRAAMQEVIREHSAYAEMSVTRDLVTRVPTLEVLEESLKRVPDHLARRVMDGYAFRLLGRFRAVLIHKRTNCGGRTSRDRKSR